MSPLRLSLNIDRLCDKAESHSRGSAEAWIDLLIEVADEVDDTENRLLILADRASFLHPFLELRASATSRQIDVERDRLRADMRKAQEAHARAEERERRWLMRATNAFIRG